MYGNGHMDGGWGFAMILGMIGVWALVVVGVIWLVRSNRLTNSSAQGAGGSTTSSAQRILAERLARGEIDQTEYESLHRTLTG